jgi:replicative DNA helicase
LNRESRKEKRQPQLYDLRDSGGIEQDADVVLLLHCDLDPEQPRPDDLPVSLHLRKQRNGVSDRGIKMTFIRPYYTFKEDEERR